MIAALNFLALLLGQVLALVLVTGMLAAFPVLAVLIYREVVAVRVNAVEEWNELPAPTRGARR